MDLLRASSDHVPINWDFVEQPPKQTATTNTAQAVMLRLAKGLDLNTLIPPEKNNRIVRPLLPERVVSRLSESSLPSSLELPANMLEKRK